MEKQKGKDETHPVLGPEFKALRTLWEGEASIYPSEQSARWALRHLNTRLAAAGALALTRGRLYFHREKLVAMLRDDAVQRAARVYLPRAPRVDRHCPADRTADPLLPRS